MPNLARDYGLQVDALRPHPGGFESECLVADSTWFIKIWRSNEPPARLEVLNELHAAGLPVPAPVPAGTGELHAWWSGRPYAVFPYIRGRAPDDDDWQVTARALRRVHELDGIDLPRGSMDEPAIWWLRDHLDHPWIKDRGREVAERIRRLERAIARAAAKEVPHVVCHRDFLGQNLLVDNREVVAILDWEQAVLAPREHDLWAAAEGRHGQQVLAEYGARDLDLDHFEYALLARALRDISARVASGTDRPGVDPWGFRRIARLDSDLEMFRPFCA
ncbi:MAG: phosphotransferase enzyme family protein [Trebonia sp.]